MTSTIYRQARERAEDDAAAGVTHVPIEHCYWCGDPFVRLANSESFWPYCSSGCATRADCEDDCD